MDSSEIESAAAGFTLPGYWTMIKPSDTELKASSPDNGGNWSNGSVTQAGSNDFGRASLTV